MGGQRCFGYGHSQSARASIWSRKLELGQIRAGRGGAAGPRGTEIVVHYQGEEFELIPRDSSASLRKTAAADIAGTTPSCVHQSSRAAKPHGGGEGIYLQDASAGESTSRAVAAHHRAR